MESYTMTLKFTGGGAKLLLTKGGDELLRAALPSPARLWTGKPAKALLEALAIWLDATLRVVLSVVEPADGFSLELTDELGTGLRTLFYEVVTVEPRPRRRHRRLRGVGNFRDLHQLCLLDRLTGGGR